MCLMHLQALKICESKKEIEHLYQRDLTLRHAIERSGGSNLRCTFRLNEMLEDDPEDKPENSTTEGSL